VELVCVGTELLTGNVNTHTSYFAGALLSAGLRLDLETAVPDETDRIRDALRGALERSDVVLVSGGLGPTFDDLTREGAAAALGRRLRLIPELLDRIRAKFRRAHLPMPRANRRQAWLVEGARALENLSGSAPGQLFTKDRKEGRQTLVLLPGPGEELKPIFERDVLPFLKRTYRAGLHLATGTFRLTGLMESEADERIRSLVRGSRGKVEFTILAGGGLVEIRATARGRTEKETQAGLRRVRRALRKALGPRLYGEGEDTLEGVVGEKLRRRGETLAVAESCTGGLLAGRVTSIPGSSDYFLGGVVCYSNDVKVRELGISPETLRRHGAVSEACARELAQGARKKVGADWALSVTGIAGPGGGTPQKPVGLVFIGLAGRRAFQARRFLLHGDRLRIRTLATVRALDLLRQAL